MARYVVCSAWPYVNNVPHLGTMIGSLLSGDVYARFLKLMGEEVIYVSGSDEHGSPIELEARRLGVEPKTLTDAMHSYVVELIKRWDIEFSNYTRTHNPTHIEFVREIMMRLYENGYVRRKTEVLPYCPIDKAFLADRFVVGRCPHCGYERARGDQCENCGRLLHPTELIEARCAICGAEPEQRETSHWFFDLPKLRDRLLEWLRSHRELPDSVRNYSLSWVEEGLRERSITRDSSWGVPAPFPGAEGKTIYVWFEALLGYLSATKEYYEKLGRAEEFERTWLDPNTRTVYFIGKDNIPFHAIILPAMLMASGRPYALPWQIGATEYLLFHEEKFSKSRGVGVWADEALELLPADYWRFALIRMRPETKDTSFSWREFYRVVNDELNDDVGNYIHRVLTFAKRKYGSVPGPGSMEAEDAVFWSDVERLTKRAIEMYSSTRLRAASDAIVELARRGNQYLNARAPWDLVRDRPSEAEAVIYLALNSLRTLALLLYPIMPSSSSKLYSMLGLEGPKPGEMRLAGEISLRPGHELGQPEPLFRKLPEDFPERADELLAEARNRAQAGRPRVAR